MKLSVLIFSLLKFRIKGIKHIDFFVSRDIPPVDYCSFLISDKTKTITLINYGGY